MFFFNVAYFSFVLNYTRKRKKALFFQDFFSLYLVEIMSIEAHLVKISSCQICNDLEKALNKSFSLHEYNC